MCKKAKKALILLLGVFLVVSCVREGGLNTKPPKEHFFDFRLEQEVDLSIDYGFINKDYVVLFEVYDQYPLSTDANGVTTKKSIQPLYRGSTDAGGKYNSKVVIPSSLVEVWIHTDYPGVVSPVKASVLNKAINYTQKDYIKTLGTKTRATTATNHKYPDDWLILGDWDKYGTPSYMEPESKLPPANVLYTINELFIKYASGELQKRYPEFFNGVTSDVKIVKPTEVVLTFIHSGASMRNTIGYFTYPTDNPPTNVAQIKKILAFPAATPYVKDVNGREVRGAMLGGDQVKLKYWDGTQFHDEFPAGVSIGWFLEANSFQEEGNVVPQGFAPCRYSLSQLNANGTQRTVSLRDSKSDRIVAIAFEDNLDNRYNDATFYLGVKEEGAIDTETPVLPDMGGPKDEENYTTYFGTLAFEDLWPHTGDYDMNDVMIDYTSTVYKNLIGNKVYKVVDEFVVRPTGGSLISGFGYQYHKLTSTQVISVNIEANGVTSRYMEGQPLESGQTRPTVLLFDDANLVVGKKITVTTKLADVPETLVIPPYNPFIFAESDKTRGREVHLPMYPPTDKVDKSLLGTSMDASRPNENLFYVTIDLKNQFPFALNMTGVQKEFPTPRETVRIDVSYPKFKSWVESKGQEDKDWYK